jgi:hypothetical protein
MCDTHGKIAGNISQWNLIETPSSPTAFDLIPRFASKTSMSVTLEKEKSSSLP